jgi:hypothetical protein
MPYHLDPFSWPKRRILIPFVMLFFNLLQGWRLPSFRPLLLFQVGTAVCFVIGAVARGMEAYGFLKFMPFRLFPALVPLFFFFALAHLLASKEKKPSGLVRLLMAFAGALGLMVAGNPVNGALDKLDNTRWRWHAPEDGFIQSAKWISAHTSPDAICILPPWKQEGMYLTRRGSIVHLVFHTYDRMGEWRERLKDLVGDLESYPPDSQLQEMEAHYSSLGPEKIESLAAKYHAGYLVSRGVCPFPVLFQADGWRVYRLAAATP